MREAHDNRPLLASKRDIELTQEDISQRLERWRDQQAVHMPSVKLTVLSDDFSLLEDEILHLPSHFSDQDRKEFGLEELAREELALRRAQVVDCVLQLRRTAKKLSAAQGQKKKDTRGQNKSGRAHALRSNFEFHQDCLLRIYNTGRRSLISLSAEKLAVEESFPRLTAHDLFRKPTTESRQLGDSRRPDGMLWGLGARVDTHPESLSLLQPPNNSPQQINASARGQSSHFPSSSSAPDKNEMAAGRTDASSDEIGKLWNPIIGLSAEEVEEWEREGMSRYSSANTYRHAYRGYGPVVSHLGNHGKMARGVRAEAH